LPAFDDILYCFFGILTTFAAQNFTRIETYEPVIGLEVHIQLLTQSKAYSSDPNAYGEAPNTHVSPITLAHPGTLPCFNAATLHHAIRLGLACGCSFTEVNRFARKNYFYADLPKGYQITQDDTPICKGGKMRITLPDGTGKDIRLIRIHMEEDSGKSIHDIDPFHTFIDLNRAGVPLLEMVSEPDVRSGVEAYQYLMEVRKLVRYLEICDGNMEEGSLRCDANISLRPKGREAFGTKVEVKNMNSMRNVQRAIEYEIQRQAELLDRGEEIAHETRSFDAVAGITFSMRSKEEANDYRYFPEPDLQPVRVDARRIEAVEHEMPPLPWELYDRYTKVLQLSDYDARVITENKAMALYFEELISHTDNHKSAANRLMTDIKGYLNQQAIEIDRFPVKPIQIARLIALVDNGKVSNSVASQRIFPILCSHPEQLPEDIARTENLIQESDTNVLDALAEQALAKYPEKVAEYKAGKKGLIGLFMGELMKLSGGKADPKVATKLLQQKLEQ
jgi:aspartyl-tRNA(Asn)/glutamyl-tRNA(Gln) amidotransferase subunit B